MKNRWKFIIIFSIICSLLTGCSLAVEDAENGKAGDKLVGVLITKEHIDLFDFDTYMNEHVSVIANEGEVIIDDTSGYANKLYAIESDENQSGIVFEGIEGVILLSLEETDESGESYLTTKNSDGLSDLHTAINVQDEMEEIIVSGKIYTYPSNANEEIYYANPIYQEPDGDIYTIGGSGYYMNTSCGEGEQMGTSFSTETKETINGKSKAEKSTVEVKYMLMYKPVEITLYQMSKEHTIIQKTEYEPGNLPESINADTNTAYFLIETQKEDLEGNIFYMREVFEPSLGAENYLNTYTPMGNGILTKQQTEIIWDE
ncbi:MAG: hypothetical protein MR936_15140 [Eubacterium sp.]|nr:hypothetical protein [Eubacterium sp.]